MGPEQITPYAGSEADKGAQVEQMFDSIAPAYDFMNTAMTFGLHRYWRRRALSLLARALPAEGSLRLLDVACGTGDVAFALRRSLGSRAAIEGIDLSTGMLAVARARLEQLKQSERSGISFMEGDCLKLPMADATYDAVTVAYGVRNFADLSAGLAQMRRVLKPGGVLCIIELCEPAGPLMRAAYHFYSRRLIPLVGRLVSGQGEAYSYLPRSIEACPARSRMTELMSSAGLKKASYRVLIPGVVAIYMAHR